MSTLDDLAFECGTDKGMEKSPAGLSAKKYTTYYSAHLAHLRQEPIRLLEIGVARGCSTVMWELYFPHAVLYGIDIDPGCKKYDMPRTTIFIGDQADEAFLQDFVDETGGNFDVVIDDGGHVAEQQICSFLTLFPHVKPGGYYVIEDLHTSYDKGYGGGYKADGSIVEFLKDLVDCVNRWLVAGLADDVRKTIAAVHFYKGITFIQRSPL